MNRVTFRPIAAGDEAFLFQVYASTRAAEMALVPWDDAQKHAFLQMQFALQHQDYLQNYSTAEFLIVLCDDRPAGRLYVERGEQQILIIDIAILPEFQTGIGAAIIRQINAEADRTGKVVRGTVERFNRAMLLFHRLGFVATKDVGLFLSVERQPLVK